MNGKTSNIRLTTNSVKALAATGKRYIVFDTEMRQLGVRVSENAQNKSFVLKYFNGTQQFYTLGRFGTLSVKGARDAATAFMANVALGKDPKLEKSAQKNKLTMEQLCQAYSKNGMGHKKETTIENDKRRIRNYIVPLLGKTAVVDLKRKDIKQFHLDAASGKSAKFSDSNVRGGTVEATRVVRLLQGIFNYAIEQEIIESNPAHNLKLPADKKVLRYLDKAELASLKSALAEAETSNPVGTAIIRVLLLTGCRKSEINNLKWSEVNFEGGFLELEDSKTGAKKLPLSKQVASIIKSQPRIEGSPYVFPGTNPQKPYGGLRRFWPKLLKKAAIANFRIHDLRHTFASVAASNGVELIVVSKLLGHADISSTMIYAHLFDNKLKDASGQVASMFDI